MVAKLWSKDGDEAAAATKALLAEPLAWPVLRVGAVTDLDPAHRGTLERLATEVEKGRDKAVVKLLDQWTKDGRLDLLTEVRSLTDGKAAELALDGLLRAVPTLRILVVISSGRGW